jgi:PEP-CTERM motif
MKQLLCFGALIIGTLLPLSAAPITFTFAFTGTGNVGASSFTSKSVLLTLTGDTSIVALNGSTYILEPLVSTTVAIAGFPLATFNGVGTTYIFSATGTGVGGFGRGGDLLQVTNGLFSGYNLQTAVAAQSIGPWTGGGFDATGLATDQGNITLFPSGNITFAASGGVAANVPEPTTFALFGLGILGFIVSVLRTRYHPRRLAYRTVGTLEV